MVPYAPVASLRSASASLAPTSPASAEPNVGLKEEGLLALKADVVWSKVEGCPDLSIFCGLPDALVREELGCQAKIYGIDLVTVGVRGAMGCAGGGVSCRPAMRAARRSVSAQPQDFAAKDCSMGTMSVEPVRFAVTFTTPAGAVVDRVAKTFDTEALEASLTTFFEP